MKKGVLFALFVGGMHHDLRGTDNVHVHFHAYLEKEQFGVGLQPVNFQNIRIVGIIHPHPKIGVHPGGKLAEHHRMFGNSHDRDNPLAFKAIAVDLGIFGVFDLFVRDILVIRVPSIPSYHKGQGCLLADLFGTFFPHRIKSRFHRRTVRQLGRSRNDTLSAGNYLRVRRAYIVEDAFDNTVKKLLLVGTNFRTAFRCGNFCCRISATCGGPYGITDVFVFFCP